jgi:hypothetical protein
MSPVYKSWTLTAGLLGLAGCGSGEWLDIPNIDCNQLETNRAEVEFFAPGVCGDLTYGGELRCRDDKVQVLCSEP